MNATHTFLPTLSLRHVVLISGAISALSLIMALIGQYGFDLHPCVLCIYQRIPFIFIVALSGLSLLLKHNRAHLGLAIMTGLAFIINAGIAFFHTGVERKWWEGLSSCGGELPKNPTLEQLREAILNAPVARCDEIPFELFGLSMANYNVLLCVFMAAFVLLYIKRNHLNVTI